MHAMHAMPTSASSAAQRLTLPEAQRSLDTTPVYRCPMHPEVIASEPGSCPICGMALVMDDGGSMAGTGHAPVVSLDGGLVQSLGVRIATAEQRAVEDWISAPGRTRFDETRLYHLHPRAAGWIEGLTVRAEGDPVTAGQTLAALYAPEILSAQVSFLIALGEASSARQVTNARNLLRLLAVPDDVILDIEESGETRNTVPVVAPSNGVITRLEARDGMYVEPDTAMFTIADLSKLWLLAHVRESESALVAIGQEVEVEFDALPGRSYRGAVDYLYPDLDAATRSRPLRVVLDNSDGELQPEMWARARIRVGDGIPALAIPRGALLEDGHTSQVLLALGDGRFQPRAITPGRRFGDWVEVRGGLQAGERVVASAQFLIDSESDLQAELSRLSAAEQDAGVHHHGH